MADVSCVDTVEHNLLSEENVTPATCNCYDPCNEFKYRPTIHALEYPILTPESGLAENMLQQVEVYYETLKYHRFTEIPVYSTTELSSSIGT